MGEQPATPHDVVVSSHLDVDPRTVRQRGASDRPTALRYTAVSVASSIAVLLLTLVALFLWAILLSATYGWWDCLDPGPRELAAAAACTLVIGAFPVGLAGALAHGLRSRYHALSNVLVFATTVLVLATVGAAGRIAYDALTDAATC